MMKKPGWENRLISFVSSVSRADFVPSERDCGMFCADAILAMTGEDFGAELRGKYKSIARAQVMLNGMGFADHVEYAASKFEEWPSPLFAQRGDLVAVRDGEEVALGIVQGAMVYVMRPENGMGLVPLTLAFRAFKI